MQIDHHTYDLIRRRAAYPILLKYSVNRYELWMLSQMAGMLKHKGNVIMSQAIFFRNVTGNHVEKKKMSGYYLGLLNKKMIGAFEWIGRPGSESFGISDLGARVLAEYDNQLQVLALKLGAKKDRIDSFETGDTGKTTYLRKSA